MMYAPSKLTKKQKKGVAFRERTGKRRSRNDLIEVETTAVPVMEDQDIASVECDTLQDQKKHREGDETVRVSEDKEGRVASKGKEKSEEKDISVSVEVVKTTKRKRAREDGVQEDETSKSRSRKLLKRKKDNDVTQSNETKGKTAVKQRFILFVGNLKYTTTREAIQAHFAICDPSPAIRLLTPTSGVQRAKSKGCAFLEFTHRNALQQALKLHQSTLEGRMINVELTAGGGGKSEARLAKVRERNKALLVQRTERIEMEDPNGDRISQKPQRFSATSGMEQVPVAKRSWTVGDGDDTSHRGGIKHKKKSKAKAWGTGVNAIPVG